ncbi:hypothetical protein FKM82_028039 [Ascaphus truei]
MLPRQQENPSPPLSLSVLVPALPFSLRFAGLPLSSLELKPSYLSRECEELPGKECYRRSGYFHRELGTKLHIVSANNNK